MIKSRLSKLILTANNSAYWQFSQVCVDFAMSSEVMLTSQTFKFWLLLLILLKNIPTLTVKLFISLMELKN